MTQPRSIDDIVVKLKGAKGREQGGTLLVGPECSVKAGIPSNSELLEIVQNTFPQAYEKAKTKDIPGCMAALTLEEKSGLIGDYIKRAKINWAHIGMALLMKQGYVDRVLTTAYDSLIVRACSVVGETLPVYDCSIAKIAQPDLLPQKAIFNLCGQGFPSAPEFIDEVFRKAEERGPWIAVGFDVGHDEKNPIIERLKKLGPFEDEFYWIHAEGTPLPTQIEEGLLSDEKNIFCVDSYDPDSFFVTLIQRMGILPPDLAIRPFSYLGGLLKSLAPFPIPGQEEELEITDIPLQQAQKASEQYEGDQGEGHDYFLENQESAVLENPELLWAIQSARNSLVSGDMKKILEHREQYDKTPAPQLAELLCLGYSTEAENIIRSANSASKEEAFSLYEGAGVNYMSALEIDPESYSTYLKWGKVLVGQAELRSGEEADALYGQAGEKFANALEKKYDLVEGYDAWGYALIDQAVTKSGKEADPFFEKAIEKFQACIEVHANHFMAHYGLGVTLSRQARKKKGMDSLRLFGQAAEKFQAALKISPNNTDAIIQLGQALFVFSKSKRAEEADRILSLSIDKFQQALKINPDLAEAYFGWGKSLLERGLTRTDSKVEGFLTHAIEKFKAALEINPKLRGAHYRWGLTMIAQAQSRKEIEAVRLYNEAVKKFETAIEIDPKKHDAFTQWGRVYLMLSEIKKGPEKNTILNHAVEKFEASCKLFPYNPEAFTYWGKVFFRLADDKKGEEAIALLNKAVEKYKSALEIKSDYMDGHSSWGNALFRMAQIKKGAEADALHDQAEEKYQSALKIQPNDTLALDNWGSIILNRSRSKTGKESEALLSQAANIFQSALEIKEDMPEALNHMGEVLMEQAKIKKGINAHPLLAEAKQKLQTAEDISPGSASYNTARLMALLANETGCKEWLAKCKGFGTLPDGERLMADTSLISVRESKWFKSLVESRKPKTGEKAQAG